MKATKAEAAKRARAGEGPEVIDLTDDEVIDLTNDEVIDLPRPGYNFGVDVSELKKV